MYVDINIAIIFQCIPEYKCLLWSKYIDTILKIDIRWEVFLELRNNDVTVKCISDMLAHSKQMRIQYLQGMYSAFTLQVHQRLRYFTSFVRPFFLLRLVITSSFQSPSTQQKFQFRPHKHATM